MLNQNKCTDKSLMTGERSIGKTLFHCTKDQLWRYLETLNNINRDNSVLDLGCGCGYGSLILSNKAKSVLGIDDSKETIDYANKYYKKPNINYICKNVFELKNIYDSVVALEIIEHIKDYELLFKHFEKICKKTLIITVPENSAKNNNCFHWKHYSVEEIVNLINSINFKVEKLIIPNFSGGKAIFCVAKRNL